MSTRRVLQEPQVCRDLVHTAVCRERGTPCCNCECRARKRLACRPVRTVAQNASKQRLPRVERCGASLLLRCRCCRARGVCGARGTDVRNKACSQTQHCGRCALAERRLHVRVEGACDTQR